MVRWASRESSQTLLREKTLTPERFKYFEGLNKGYGMGSGIYMAKGLHSSMSYGESVIAIEIEKGSLYLDYEDVTVKDRLNALGVKSEDLAMTKLPLLIRYSSDWYVSKAAQGISFYPIEHPERGLRTRPTDELLWLYRNMDEDRSRSKTRAQDQARWDLLATPVIQELKLRSDLSAWDVVMIPELFDRVPRKELIKTAAKKAVGVSLDSERVLRVFIEAQGYRDDFVRAALSLDQQWRRDQTSIFKVLEAYLEALKEGEPLLPQVRNFVREALVSDAWDFRLAALRLLRSPRFSASDRAGALPLLEDPEIKVQAEVFPVAEALATEESKLALARVAAREFGALEIRLGALKSLAKSRPTSPEGVELLLRLRNDVQLGAAASESLAIQPEEWVERLREFGVASAAKAPDPASLRAALERLNAPDPEPSQAARLQLLALLRRLAATQPKLLLEANALELILPPSLPEAESSGLTAQRLSLLAEAPLPPASIREQLLARMEALAAKGYLNSHGDAETHPEEVFKRVADALGAEWSARFSKYERIGRLPRRLRAGSAKLRACVLGGLNLGINTLPKLQRGAKAGGKAALKVAPPLAQIVIGGVGSGAVAQGLLGLLEKRQKAEVLELAREIRERRCGSCSYSFDGKDLVLHRPGREPERFRKEWNVKTLLEALRAAGAPKHGD